MAGQLVGSFVWGYIADKYGRVFTIRKTMLLGIIAGILVAFSVDLAMM